MKKNGVMKCRGTKFDCIESIGEYLKVLRTTRKMTQASFANAIDMSTSSYARIERGEDDIPFSVFVGILDLFSLKAKIIKKELFLTPVHQVDEK